MKLTVGKRRRLLLVLGVLVVVVLANYVRLAFTPDPFQQDFDMIQIGMTIEDAQRTVSRGESGTIWAAHAPGAVFVAGESESDEVPGRRIYLKWDKETRRIVAKSLRNPGLNEYWQYWMWKIGGKKELAVSY